MNTFEKLAGIDCSQYIEKKRGLNYLSWSWAVELLLKEFPEATWEFEENPSGSHLFTYPDETGEVRASVKINGVTRTCSLPVMDYRNASIKNPDACAINKAKMRALAKAIALHGLGLYIYSGEDLPSAPDLSALREAMNGSKEQVIEYLVHNGGLQEGQDIEELPDSWKKRAIQNPRALVKAAKEFSQNKKED